MAPTTRTTVGLLSIIWNTTSLNICACAWFNSVCVYAFDSAVWIMGTTEALIIMSVNNKQQLTHNQNTSLPIIPASETPCELLPYASNNSNRHNITIEETHLQLGLQLDQQQMRAWHLPTSTVIHFPKKWVCLTSRWAFNWPSYPQCSKQKGGMVE